MSADPSIPVATTKRSQLRTWLLVLTAVACTILVGTFVACWRLASAELAPVHFVVGEPPSDLPCEPFRLDSRSGAKIAGWYIPVDHARGVVVLAHPIKGSRLNMLERARLFRSSGYAVVMIDLRGHGESTGDSITIGNLERYDVRAAVEFARSRHPGQPIAVNGWSLGGAAALMASPLEIDALILEEVFPTIEEAVQDRTRIRVGPLGPLAAAILVSQLEPRLGIAPDKLRPIEKLASVECPVLLLAGSDDRHTTAAETRRMFDAAREPKECVFFDGAAHVDLQRYDPARYRQATLDFLDAHMHAKQPAVR
jgi:uncharacterized protein